MSVGANSYGSAAGVAAYTRAYMSGAAVAGVYDSLTNPTLAQVESWIDEVSAIANTGLREAGFVVPVTQADAVLALRGMVNQQVADLVAFSRGVGRFFSERAQNSSMSAMGFVRKEMIDFINNNADGWEALGASRASAQRNTIAFRDTDESGNPTFPIFQRSAHGNTFTDWDGG